MLNYLWAGMILIGVIYGAITGRMSNVTDGLIESATEAVSLCIKMLGIMSMWTGIMKIAENSGLIESLTKKIRPIVRWLFPGVPAGHKAEGYISTNMIANLLGLGWAATPAGLMAMKELAAIDMEKTGGTRKGIASNDMCTFLVINISSIQLIPVNIIAYRAEYGSVSPASIIVPGLIATTINTLVAVIFCKIAAGKNK